MWRCPGNAATLDNHRQAAPGLARFATGVLETVSTDPAWEFQRSRDLLDSAEPAALPEGHVDARAEIATVDRRLGVAPVVASRPAGRDTVTPSRTRTTTRREFMATALVAAAAGASALLGADADSLAVELARLDGHFHRAVKPRPNIAHMDGCGVTKAVILATRRRARTACAASQGAVSGRVVWAVSTTSRRPTLGEIDPGGQDGAVGFGEMKFPSPPTARSFKQYTHWGRARRADHDPLPGSGSLRGRR